MCYSPLEKPSPSSSPCKGEATYMPHSNAQCEMIIAQYL